MKKEHFLDREDILMIHQQVLTPEESPRFLNESLFDSAIYSIYAGFGGMDFYPTIEEKAARLCFQLARNHSFENGNKRTAMVSMITLLSLNHIALEYTEDEFLDLGNQLAEITYENVYDWVCQHQVRKERSSKITARAKIPRLLKKNAC